MCHILLTTSGLKNHLFNSFKHQQPLLYFLTWTGVQRRDWKSRSARWADTWPTRE